jgi:hypothetical protein
MNVVLLHLFMTFISFIVLRSSLQVSTGIDIVATFTTFTTFTECLDCVAYGPSWICQCSHNVHNVHAPDNLCYAKKFADYGCQRI